MKRTKIIYALLLACASITLPGCSDLTPVDYSEINPSNFLTHFTTLSPPYYSAKYPYFKIALFVLLLILLCPLPIFFPKIKYVSNLYVPRLPI